MPTAVRPLRLVTYIHEVDERMVNKQDQDTRSLDTTRSNTYDKQDFDLDRRVVSLLRDFEKLRDSIGKVVHTTTYVYDKLILNIPDQERTNDPRSSKNGALNSIQKLTQTLESIQRDGKGSPADLDVIKQRSFELGAELYHTREYLEYIHQTLAAYRVIDSNGSDNSSLHRIKRTISEISRVRTELYRILNEQISLEEQQVTAKSVNFHEESPAAV